MNQLTPTQRLVAQMFKDEQGDPIHLTPGQDYLFSNIFGKLHPRVHCMCHTRFGKSMTVALGVLTSAATYPEKWAIMAGTREKAKIIMDYVIAHIFDNDYTKSRFVPDKGETIESIRRHRNKNRLTFATDQIEGGKTLLSDIIIGSAKDALGLGAPNIVQDESALIPDNDHSLVMRMLGDDPTKNFLIKVGNPFERNHFLKSYRDPKYKKIVIDCYKSLSEGRITQETIDENKPYAFFKILYECQFPSANEIDEQGWMALMVDFDIETATKRTVMPVGRGRLGVDVAKGGRNWNSWCLRGDNWAKILLKNKEESSVTIADQTITFMKEYGVLQRDVFIDDTGVGHGVVSVLRDKGHKVNAVNFGEQAEKKEEYTNIRAESYAGKEGLQTWIKTGAYLTPHPDWPELTKIRYKKDIGGRTKIEPKEDMRKRGIESPDVADSLALTFAKVKISYYTGIDPKAVSGRSENERSAFGGVGHLIPGIG